MLTERVTITMPKEMVAHIDRISKNRSRFIVHAVERELLRRLKEELRLSLRNPHEESSQVAELGIEEWGASLPGESDLLDPESGRDVRWRAPEGWSLDKELDEGEPE